ncbi:MAG: hypothetical protein EBR73_12180 [Rhodobacteraceae bacterium]|nr:hypothetical protein [Paracoccaceae bacterium]
MTLRELLEEVAAGWRSARPLSSMDGLVTSWWCDGVTLVHAGEAYLSDDVALPVGEDMPQSEPELLALAARL